MESGLLYLIPTTLGEGDIANVIPENVRKITSTLDTFIVEHPKTARQFLKQIGTITPLQNLQLLTLDEHTKADQLLALLEPVFAGKNVGLISEAGCPAVADPGANLVRLAHERNIKVIPLVGPSSILLSLMASGLNGQRFAFHGYLPVDKSDRGQKIKELEAESKKLDKTQIFIETPYRNLQLFEALTQTCDKHTRLCIATDITTAGETILTKKIADWKKQTPDIQKKPSIFLLYNGQ
ncbi:SAM-dependent methyltransferase [Sulfurirhabdus autotrophica]|uniref:16S rRNA (Cytidine1402-2'-O)-methyltransferase n=1 Tax=Sulfurirhabdus autotrophica TaxID=1706046 RepID=A0A4R3YFT6_9PROT|nr:SAM-dependent methyltransferase [Sulfurirhabdus autotrophica]TCV90058.1 16S rRNA (cytidine1402-2'-O)-methyltransferase [Sulfurirhabdus autotrophica]